MDLKKCILFSVFLFLEFQKWIYCLRLYPSSSPCCNSRPLPDFTTNPIYNPLVLDSELDPFTTGQKNFGLTMPSPFPNIDETDPQSVKAYSCSLIPCFDEDSSGAVCACNYNTGNVVTFTKSCEMEKHNCRFDTNFKVILNEICPWEFESRRTNKEYEVDLTDPKYYN